MFEDFTNALQNFKMNKIRTILSLLGVIIGVASVIIITTLGQSATENIKGSFGSSGLDIVRISQGFMNRRSGASVSFNQDFKEEIYGQIPNIKGIYYTNTMSTTLVYKDLSVSATATCIENGYLQMNNMELESGSYFTISDNVQGAQKIILGSEIAAALFPDGGAVGKTITLIYSNIRFGFEVVGVLKESTSGIESSTTGVYIPRGFYSKKIMPNPNAGTVVIQCTDQNLSSTVADDI